MPNRISKAGIESFFVDKRDDCTSQRYLHDWRQLSKATDMATAYFEIGGLPGEKNGWQKVDAMRILIGDEISHHTK